MRILHLVLTDSFAGAEQHVCVLASAQVSHGHRVEVWGGASDAMGARLDSRIVHRRCSRVSHAVRIGLHARHDVIHVHMTKAEVAAAVFGRLGAQGTPVVATRHFAAVRGRSMAGHLIRPLIRRSVAAQISVSQFVADTIDGPSTVVYAGVPVRPAPAGGRGRVILVAQRLSPEKRTADAINAFATSGLAGDGWRLDVAGRGSEADALTSLAHRRGLDEHVTFLGFCTDLDERMQNASILLASPPAEPFGLTVAEAMAHATPVVAAAGGGHLESVGRAQPNFMFEPGDAESAGRLLGELAASPDLRVAYGRDLQRVQRNLFTTDRQYLDTQRVYEEVLNR